MLFSVILFMLNKTLVTPVDDLVKIIIKKDPCSTTELSSQLRIPLELIERWLVVLEEFGIIKVHYKGLDGWVSLNKNSKFAKSKEDVDLEQLKDTFIGKCKEKNLSYDEITRLWPVFLKQNDQEIKSIFYTKAKDMGFDVDKTDRAWQRFETELYKI